MLDVHASKLAFSGFVNPNLTPEIFDISLFTEPSDKCIVDIRKGYKILIYATNCTITQCTSFYLIELKKTFLCEIK